MLAWMDPKMEHKHMRERLYQLNIPIILCCSAERKIAMIKNAEGKTEPIDIGLQPVCEGDMPWAMTVSLMLPDVTKPGVPVPIKALLPDLRQIIRLDTPLDEATGERIGAWGRGNTLALGEATAPNRLLRQAQVAAVRRRTLHRMMRRSSNGQRLWRRGSMP